MNGKNVEKFVLKKEVTLLSSVNVGIAARSGLKQRWQRSPSL